MQQHGSVQSSNDADNVATTPQSPLIKFHIGDQKPAHTQSSFSIAAPGRRRTSLVSIVSHVPFIRPLIRLWKRGWTAEVLSCLFALLSLLGLVATLIAHRDKPLPQWPQLVSLNSIISLFSLFIRTGVGVVLAEGISQSKWMWYRKSRKLDDMERFDTASRGAFGSFLLLVNLGPRRPHYIAAFGALLMIMATFTGFASQQLLQFNECLQQDNVAHVAIARANAFYVSGSRTGSRQAAIAESVQVAIDVGLIQPVQDLTVTLSSGCNTGNCTFPGTVSTVGFGHSCEDVTSNMVTIPTNQTYQMKNRTLGRAYWANLTKPFEGRDESHSGRTGLLIGANWGGMATGAFSGESNGSLSILQMVLRRNLDDYNPKAYTCIIFPTINTYNVSIRNTVLREDLVESLPIGLNMIERIEQKASTDGSEPLYKRAVSSVLRNGTREACTPRDTPSDGFLRVAQVNVDAAPNYFNTDYFDNPPKGAAARISYYPKDCVFHVGLGSAVSISSYFQTLFTSGRIIYENEFVMEGPMQIQKLFRNSNITLDTLNESMGNLTNSMTTAARLGTDNQPANGTMWYSTTCLGINWAWISFDAAMIVLSAIFLVLVSVESRGVESERLWKSSVLATLFCEIDDTVTRAVKPASKEAMETIALSTSVSLDPSSRTLKLVTS